MPNGIPESARAILMKYLEELEERDLEKFKFRLEDCQVDQEHSRIPRAQLKKANDLKIIELMISHYEEEGALTIAGDLLKEINRRDLSEEFQRESQQYLAKKIRDEVEKIKDKFQQDVIEVTHEQMDLFHRLYTMKEEYVTSATGKLKQVEVSPSTLRRGLIAVDFRALGFCLKNSPGIERVKISDSVMTPEDVTALKAGLVKCSSLLIINCSLTELCCADLSSVLSTNFSLTDLDLSRNRLWDSGVRALCEGLKDPGCRIQRLLLIDCSLTDSSCADLASVLKTYTSLKELHLSRNRLRDAGVRELCEGLKHPDCTIQRLVLDLCSLTASSFADLASVLRRNRTLTSLDLSNNAPGCQGVSELCEGLKHPDCNIVQLVLICCSLTASCCADLSSVLSTNTSLKDLYLNWNTLEDSGARELCEGLNHPACNLQELSLIHNELTDACAEDLRSALHTNPTLRLLDLSDNHFTESAANSFSGFQKNVTIKVAGQ